MVLLVHRQKRLYIPGDYQSVKKIAESLSEEFFEPHHPHNYFDRDAEFTKESMGNDIVLCDVGAAEGLFSLLLVDQCKKIYLIENDSKWMSALRLSFAPYKDKVEIIPLTIGDGTLGSRLDDVFLDREIPTLVKMDIEGFEAAALRGMTGLLGSTLPLIMLICTYHRQSDWAEFSKLLHEKGFLIESSDGYFWHMPDPMPPFFRHGVMRAVRRGR